MTTRRGKTGAESAEPVTAGPDEAIAQPKVEESDVPPPPADDEEPISEVEDHVQFESNAERDSNDDSNVADEPAQPGDEPLPMEVENPDASGRAGGDPASALKEALAVAKVERARAASAVTDARRRRDRLIDKRGRTQSSLSAVENDLDRYGAALEDLNRWRSARSGSFAWQLTSAMDGQRAALEKDYQDLRQALSGKLSLNIVPPSALQDRFMRRVITWGSLLFALFVLITTLKYAVPALTGFQSVINPFNWPTYALILVLIAVFALLWIVSAVSLYRALSERRFLLAKARAHVAYLEDAARAMRVERQRLTALHSQVPDYLRFMSEVLHRPWQAPTLVTSQTPGSPEGPQNPTPEEIVYGAERPDPSYFPYLMRVAETPNRGGGPNESILVRDAVRSLLVRGWRYGTLTDLLEAVELELALTPGSLAPERLDRDPKLRTTVMQALEESNARAIAGRKRLRELAQVIQVSVMDDVHPLVCDIAPDPLLELQTETDLLNADYPGLKGWDDFLAENLDEPGSWGAVSFSLAGRREMTSNESRRPVSSAYAAERLRPRAFSQLDFKGIAEKSARPIEFTVRVDMLDRRIGPEWVDVFERVTTMAGDVGALSAMTEEFLAVPEDAVDDVRITGSSIEGDSDEIRPNF